MLGYFSDKFHNPWGPKKRTPEDFEDLVKQVKRFQDRMFAGFGFGGGSGGSGDQNKVDKKIVKLVLSVVFAAWLSTGFFTIQPDEEGIILRFGKYVRSASPGLNYKLPLPVETVTKLSVTTVNKEEVGFRSAGKRITSRAELLENTVSSESQMLTTDENIVDINFEVQWQISSGKDFLFNVYDVPGEHTVKFAAESAMREVIGLSKIGDVLAEERSNIEVNAKNLMQSMLDLYGIGVRIMRVQLLRVEPPQQVLDAYRDVQNAKQDKEKEINRAYAYRNDVLPRARGRAEQVIQEAEGYKHSAVASATGEATRFEEIYEKYKSAREVTRKRMYLEAVEEVLADVEKIIVDKQVGGHVLPYLPLSNDLKKGGKDE